MGTTVQHVACMKPLQVSEFRRILWGRLVAQGAINTSESISKSQQLGRWIIYR